MTSALITGLGDTEYKAAQASAAAKTKMITGPNEATQPPLQPHKMPIYFRQVYRPEYYAPER